MNLIYFGTGTFGLPSLEALFSSKHRLLTVVTGHDKPKGRSLRPTPSPVKDWALQKGVPVFEYTKINEPETLARLSAMNADVFVVIAFGVIFSADFLRIPKVLPVNVHSSLLPKYRGAAPIHRAIMNGDRKTGVSVVRVIEKLDAGDVLGTAETPILPEDDIVSLETRLADLGAKALLESLGKISEGKATFSPQDDTLSTYARKIEKEEGRIDWSKPATQIHDRVRALKVWPVCSSSVRGKRVLFLESRFRPEAVSARPGTILSASRNSGIVVATGEGALEVLKLQMEGRTALPSADFLNGFPLKAGELFE
ncbi:MAG TPA: methionyl-tRNA formyltransferase [Candidatus Omnitrophota bacterium]|nr:methionyl-tRNA formyltransferase [Candidatus Omnitrophota bacterium]